MLSNSVPSEHRSSGQQQVLAPPQQSRDLLTPLPLHLPLREPKPASGRAACRGAKLAVSPQNFASICKSPPPPPLLACLPHPMGALVSRLSCSYSSPQKGPMGPCRHSKYHTGGGQGEGSSILGQERAAVCVCCTARGLVRMEKKGRMRKRLFELGLSVHSFGGRASARCVCLSNLSVNGKGAPQRRLCGAWRETVRAGETGRRERRGGKSYKRCRSRSRRREGGGKRSQGGRAPISRPWRSPSGRRPATRRAAAGRRRPSRKARRC